MTADTCLDIVLEDIGSFGKYQRTIVTLILIVAIMVYFPIILWVFEARQMKYRCHIPGYESSPTEYMPHWWTDVIPSIHNEPANCERYKCSLDNVTSNYALCSGFDKTKVESCDKFVYETNKTSILHDFNLHCNANTWKLTAVGTIISIGGILGLPISGMLSDRFGRKTILISSVALSALSGIIRSFSNTYAFFLLMEFVDAFSRAGSYPTCFIIGAEFVSPNKRVLISVLINIAASLGGIVVGCVAWAVPTWRMLDQILYGSCFIILSYYWFLPESMRWLLTKKRYQHISRILNTIAKTNGTTLSEEHVRQLFHTEPLLENTETYPLRKLLQSPILTKRFVNCCVCWIFCLFSYYGLTINAISLSSNGYVDFILVMLVEIPGNIAAHFLMNRIGKRYCFTLACFICGISSTSFIFIPHDLSVIRLSVYLFGKCAAAVNMTVLYSLTSEIFPTPLRASLLTSCSMFGRFGIVMASQTPLLELYWKPLPLVLFALTAFAGSILTLRFPETLNETLPNTIEQAEDIGRRKSSKRISKNGETGTEVTEKLTTRNITSSV